MGGSWEVGGEREAPGRSEVSVGRGGLLGWLEREAAGRWEVIIDNIYIPMVQKMGGWRREVEDKCAQVGGKRLLGWVCREAAGRCEGGGEGGIQVEV